MNFNLLRDNLVELAGLLSFSIHGLQINISTDGKEIMFDYLKLGLSGE